GGVVVAQGQTGGIAAHHVAVLAAAVELELLLVVPVDEVTGAAAGRPAAGRHAVARGRGRRRGDGHVAGLGRRRDVVVDLERLVREMAVEGRAVRLVARAGSGQR